MSNKWKKKLPYFVTFFRKIPIRQKQLSQILMKPPSSILIFQPGLEFPAPEAIREFFFEFSGTHEFGTFSTQTQLFLKVSKTRIRLIFLKTATGACQIPLKSILADPPWKISIKDDGFVKIRLNYLGQIEKLRKKLAKTATSKKWIFFSSLYSILYSIPGPARPGPARPRPGPVRPGPARAKSFF